MIEFICGQEFIVNGKKYAYAARTSRGLIIAYSLPDKKLTKFNGVLTPEEFEKRKTSTVRPVPTIQHHPRG